MLSWVCLDRLKGWGHFFFFFFCFFATIINTIVINIFSIIMLLEGLARHNHNGIACPLRVWDAVSSAIITTALIRRRQTMLSWVCLARLKGRGHFFFFIFCFFTYIINIIAINILSIFMLLEGLARHSQNGIVCPLSI